MRASLRSCFRVRPSSRSAGRAADDEAAILLGADHPLNGLQRASRTAREQMLAVATAQAVSGAVLVNAPPLGAALLLGATIVQLGLGLRLLVLVQTRRDVCRDLIVEGRRPQSLGALEPEWRWLSDRRRRLRLARSIEQLADMAERPGGYLAGARPYFNPRVVRAVVPELREIAALLRSEDCAVPGVALMQSLQTCGGSALYRDATAPLREELARARYLLLDSGSAATPE